MLKLSSILSPCCCGECTALLKPTLLESSHSIDDTNHDQFPPLVLVYTVRPCTSARIIFKINGVSSFQFPIFLLPQRPSTNRLGRLASVLVLVPVLYPFFVSLLPLSAKHIHDGSQCGESTTEQASNRSKRTSTKLAPPAFLATIMSSVQHKHTHPATRVDCRSVLGPSNLAR